MKRLVGGDFLLDLTPLTIELSEDVDTYTNITNEDVLKQLTNLKKFIPNPQMIKPIWVKLVNGDLDELVVVRGQLSVLDSKTFEIIIPISGYKLSILIEFTQVLNDDNEPIDDWYIDTNDAKYLFTTEAQNLAEQLSDFTGDVSITGDLEVTGDAKLFENIVDKAGHKRFIDIAGTINTIEGVSITYAKASLSGTHLLFVGAGSIANGTILTDNPTLCSFTLPEWIYNKIFTLYGSTIDILNFGLRDSGGGAQSAVARLLKLPDNVVAISILNITLSADRTFRFNFDLLIDNEEQE